MHKNDFETTLEHSLLRDEGKFKKIDALLGNLVDVLHPSNIEKVKTEAIHGLAELCRTLNDATQNKLITNININHGPVL